MVSTVPSLVQNDGHPMT